MHIQLQRRARSSLYNNLKATERNLLLENIDDWYDWHAAAEPNEPGCDAFSKHTLKRYPRKKLILSFQESIGEDWGRVAFIQVTYVTCQMIRKRPWLYPRRCSGLPKIDRVEVSAAVVCLGRFGNFRQWQVFAKKATCNFPIPTNPSLHLSIEDSLKIVKICEHITYYQHGNLSISIDLHEFWETYKALNLWPSIPPTVHFFVPALMWIEWTETACTQQRILNVPNKCFCVETLSKPCRQCFHKALPPFSFVPESFDTLVQASTKPSNKQAWVTY